jgi:hypothetical protein
MKILKKTILIISIIVIGLNHLSANPKNNQDTCKILLIGSSYFNYNNLSNLIKNLADSSNKEIFIEMHGQNGLYLSDHASSPSTEAKINERDWDYVILQGVGILVAYPEYFTGHPVYPALITLRDKIYANCESTRMVFQMPWAFEDGMTWYPNWTDTFEDMQIHIYNNTLLYSEEIGFEIAPVGWAWYAVLEEYNYPLHYLHLSDWNHPSLKGSYLMACAIYSTIFQESTVGIPYHAGIPEEEAGYFQIVASEMVLNNFELWNITPITSVIENPQTQNKIQLNQNYPNPVKHTTTISYSVQKESHVRITIIDAFGNWKKTLVDKEQRPGNYKVEFDTAWLTSGIYFYHITAGNFSETKTMIKIEK